jgi:hypothetical protein
MTCGCSQRTFSRAAHPAQAAFPRTAGAPRPPAARGLPAPKPVCAPVPCCPDCGELECLCRPRWTAGMVVSEADLNRLDHYITAKHRLHNRHLIGTGVACGLVVTCHPCGGGLISVSPGYAIGPCGDDIVVCAEDTIDVCEMIRKCRALVRREVECRPWGDTRACPELRETWVLAIRYDEQPSRDAPLLRASRDEHCDCGGSCGGTGCSCGSTKARQPRREIPLACTPTVVCETYRYEVFHAPPGPDCANPDEELPPGPLAERLKACSAKLTAVLQAQPDAPLGPDMPHAARLAWSRYCARLRAALHGQLSGGGTTRCDLFDLLCRTTCPGADLPGPAFAAAMTQAMQLLLPVAVELLQDCICLALLPPCPKPASDPRLPLALVTVEGEECRVIEICNWTPLRRILGTAPNLAYWLSATDLMARLRKQLACFCCEPLRPVRRDPRLAALGAEHIGAAPEAAGAPGATAFAFDIEGLGLPAAFAKGQRIEPREIAAALGLVTDTAEVEALKARLAKLEAEMDALRNRGPNG